MLPCAARREEAAHDKGHTIGDLKRVELQKVVEVRHWWSWKPANGE